MEKVWGKRIFFGTWTGLMVFLFLQFQGIEKESFAQQGTRMLDDFEGSDVEERWQKRWGPDGANLTLEIDDKDKKEGKQSMVLNYTLSDGSHAGISRTFEGEISFNPKGGLQIWVYNSEPNPRNNFIIDLGLNEIFSEEEKYLRYFCPLDWKGWKLITIGVGVVNFGGPKEHLQHIGAIRFIFECAKGAEGMIKIDGLISFENLLQILGTTKPAEPLPQKESAAEKKKEEVKTEIKGEQLKKGKVLMQNPSFESDLIEDGIPDYWTSVNSDFAPSLDSSTKKDGKFSFKLSTTATTTGLWSWVPSDLIPVEKNATYSFSIWMKIQNVKQTHVKIEGYDSEESPLGVLAYCPGGTDGTIDWKNYSCTFTLASWVEGEGECAFIKVMLNAGWSPDENPAITWFDNINLEKISSTPVKKVEKEEGEVKPLIARIPLGWLWEEPTEIFPIPIKKETKEENLNRLNNSSLTERSAIPIAEASGLFGIAGDLKEPWKGDIPKLKSLGNYYLAIASDRTLDKKIFPFYESPSFPVYYEKVKDLDWNKVNEEAIKFIDGYTKPPRDKKIVNVFLVSRSHEDLGSYYGGGPGDYGKKLKLALDTMDKNPDFYWSTEQGCLIYAYWIMYPEERERITKYVRSGRLEIMAPWHLFYGVWEHGEDLIENIKFCQEWVRKTFGINADTLCRSDSSAQPDQFPQIVAKLGIKNLFLSTTNSPVPESEFMWQSSEGSSVFVHRQIRSYGGIGAEKLSSMSKEDFFTLIANWILWLQDSALTDNIDIPVGGDFVPPHPELVELVRAWNKEVFPQNGYRLIMGTPGMYCSAVKKEIEEKKRNFPLVKGGDFGHPWWIGATMEGPLIKEKMREAESKLIESEKIATLASVLGMEYPDEALSRAWMLLARMYFHDGFEGCIIHFQRAGRTIGISDWIRERALKYISGKVNTSEAGGGRPLLVFNSLSWDRNDIVKVNFALPQGYKGVRVIDLDSKKDLPVQIISSSSDSDGTLKAVEILFIAENIPSMGYKLYSIVPLKEEKKYDSLLKVEKNKIENKYYSIEIKPEDGGTISIRDKEYKKEILHNGGLIREMVEPYIGGEQGIYPGAISAVYTPTPPEVKILEEGPVRTRIQLSSEINFIRISTELSIYENLRRIDFVTVLEPLKKLAVNDLHTYVAEFPFTENGVWTHATPYGHMQRQATKVENAPSDYYTAREFCDYSSSQYGLALFNRGMQTYRVYNNILSFALYRFGKGSWWNVPYNTSADYALYPHSGDWKKGKVYQEALGYNFPLIAFITDSHKGELPMKMSFLKIEKGSAMVTRIKRDGEAVTLRILETEGKNDESEIKFFKPWVESPLISLSLKPMEIKTLPLFFLP